jgi:glycogen debranching enzyme
MRQARSVVAACGRSAAVTVAVVRPDILYAWKGPSLLVVNTRGECGPDQPLSGYYFREARYLRTLRLEINGEAPWLCEATSVDPESIALTFSHPEITQAGGGGTGQSGDDEEIDAHGIPVRSLDVRMTLRVGVAEMTAALIIVNRARDAVTCDLTWTIGADFADIQEAQSGRREQEAPVDVDVRDGSVDLIYRHPQLPFRAEVGHDPRWTFRHDRLRTTLRLDPQQQEQLILRIVPHSSRNDVGADDVAGREQALEHWRERFARVDVPGNQVFEDALAKNVRDVASFPMLDGQPDEWLALQAGVPLYPAFFGRDGLTAGWQAAYLDRGAALTAALTKLGRMQSTRVDDWRDEQPGRIPYQMRSGPLALLDLNPYSAYYADFASPLMFVISLANAWAWTGDRECVTRHWDTARRILDWAREYGDADRDGFLEYQTRSSKGTKNQGWKDSGDAIIYEDGRPVPAPIATCELQGYWYIAQELMALLAWVMDAPDDARAHRESAAALKERFNRDWWIEDDNFYALALDPKKQQVRAITSNVGHCLATGIIERDRLPAVVGRMFAPDLFSGWGIRTLSTGHAFYNPLSYHRGTVWAVEQATIVFGLRRFGFDARANDLAESLFALAQLYPEYRIPECVGGYARGEAPSPGAYPRANTPQLWNASAFPLVVQTLLGLVPLAAAETLVVDPALPAWIPELILRDLRVGDAKVSLRFWRDEDGASKWEVLHTQGTLRVVRQPAPESLSARWTDRAFAALESILK